MNPIRRLYDWTINLAQQPYAIWALFLVAFFEASFFPIPPEVMLIPMIIAAPPRAWSFALITTLGSVLGALFGYVIGAFLFEQIGQPVLAFYHLEDKFEVFSDLYNRHGAWAVLAGGLTPLPFKLFTILSGSTGLNLPVFIASAFLARFVRYFIIAALLYFLGERLRGFIEKHLGLLFTLLMVLVVLGFLAIGFL